MGKGKHQSARIKQINLVDMNSSAVSETYRTLRTNIQFITEINDTKVVLITSSQPNEGKSTILANLGISLSQSGKRVLIVDADLRKPIQHYAFGVSNLVGLSHAIIDQKTDDVEIGQYVVETNYPGLFLLPSGTTPPNPAEMLNSGRFEVLIRKLRDNFDYIFIDSPPLLCLSDALVLTRVTDGVMLLVNAKKTGRHLVRKSLSSLRQVNAQVLGIVLNEFPKKFYKYEYV